MDTETFGFLKRPGFLSSLATVSEEKFCSLEIGALLVVTKAIQEPDHKISSSKLMLTSHGWERGRRKSIMYDNLWINIKQNYRLKNRKDSTWWQNAERQIFPSNGEIRAKTRDRRFFSSSCGRILSKKNETAWDLEHYVKFFILTNRCSKTKIMQRRANRIQNAHEKENVKKQYIQFNSAWNKYSDPRDGETEIKIALLGHTSV